MRFLSLIFLLVFRPLQFSLFCFSSVQSGKPSQGAFRRFVLKGNMAWNVQFDLCSGRGTAPDFESSADSLCPLSHTREPPMSIAARLQHLRVDPATVIADENAQVPG